MKLTKRIYLTVLSVTFLLQLTGCVGNQQVASEVEVPPAAVVLSSTASPAQAPTQSSRAPVQSAGEPPAEIQPESTAKSSQSQEQPDSFAVQSAAPAEQPISSVPSASTSLPEETNMNHITLEVGGNTFSATLADNEAARAFTAYLPITVQMSEMNGQEKFYDLPENLPATSSERPATIRSGDILCWSGNTLVLFYATFQNSFDGYVRLGTVDDPEGLAQALGSGSAEVIWSLAA